MPHNVKTRPSAPGDTAAPPSSLSNVVTHTIPPVFDGTSRVLVLGTMPSPASREVGFFYGHPQNRFWRVMEQLFSLPDHTLVDNDARTAFLLEHHIALWDVLASCSIEGAADSSIADPVPNDLTHILDAAPISHVFTTGGAAAKLCRRFDGSLLRERGIEHVALPSTSGANARMRLNDLVLAYSPLAEQIDMRLAKRAVRRMILARRDAMDAEDRATRSRELCRELVDALNRLPARSVVSAYAAMRTEADLDAYIRAAYERDLTVAFPCMQRATSGRQTMVMRAVSQTDYLAHDVPFINRPVASFEPSSVDEQRFPLVNPQTIRLMPVPLVAFDDNGHRLGYGGGNYDTYLPHLSSDCTVIGAAFETQRVDRVPVEEHDRTLARICCA